MTTPTLPAELIEEVAEAISIWTYATTVGHTDCLPWLEMLETDRNTYRRSATAALSTPSIVAMREENERLKAQLVTRNDFLARHYAALSPKDGPHD